MAKDIWSQSFDESDEAGLIQRLRVGSPGALEEAYDRYSAIVYQTALQICDCGADAADVVQDVFLRLNSSIQTFRGDGSFTGWLRKVSLRAALMRCRATKRRAEIPLDSVPLTAARPRSPSPIEHIALQEALEALSPKLRTVFLLKEVEGYSHQEIARSLGIRRGTSEVRLHRARQSLREQLTA